MINCSVGFTDALKLAR
uniref:Uncharacterized protein n=1 Tax=Anguilla anguilla TaxID=7936 RepID=A0A0E9Q7N8_ANGAN